MLGLEYPRLPLMRELSAKLTEGETLHSHINIFAYTTFAFESAQGSISKNHTIVSVPMGSCSFAVSLQEVYFLYCSLSFSLPPALRATSLIRGRLWGGAKSQIAQYTERCIEVRPYLFDKPGFNVLTFLSLTRKTLEKDLLAVKHSGRLNERSLCLSKELFPDSESPV